MTDDSEWREQSLWSTISELVPPSERDELRRLVGPALVDLVEDLFAEASIMMEIWRDYRSETVEQESRKRRLPEPPAIRDRLKQEIALFVSNIRQFQGQNALEQLVGQHREIIQYALDEDVNLGTQRPRTSSARTGKEVPIRPSTSSSKDFRSESRQSTQSLPAKLDKVEVVVDSVDGNNVISDLRQALEEEKQQLNEDIALLRESLESEHDYRKSLLSGSNKIPSIQTLREVRSNLQKHFLNSSSASSSDRPADASSSQQQQQTPIPPQRKMKDVNSDVVGTPVRVEGKRRVLPTVHVPGATPTSSTTPIRTTTTTTTTTMRPSSAQRFRKMVEACRDQDL